MFAPAGAQASCGDYVHVMPAKVVNSSTSEDGSTAGDSSNQTTPCHCRGANCSRAPEPIAPSAPVSSKLPPQTDAILSSAAMQPAVAPPAVAEDSNSLPVTISSSIFHPPRG
jgi:hypothetical protein